MSIEANQFSAPRKSLTTTLQLVLKLPLSVLGFALLVSVEVASVGLAVGSGPPSARGVPLYVSVFPRPIPSRPTTFPLSGPSTPAVQGAVVEWPPTTFQAGITNVVATAAGQNHSLALKADGTVLAWGHNWYGQTAIPTGLTDVVAIAAGGNHSLVLKGDGTVVAWGLDSHGQATVPPGLTNVVAIAAGYFHSLALTADGTLVAWGNDQFGQTTVPIGLTNVVAIAAGYAHSLAVQAEGTAVSWGRNSDGQTTIPPGLKNIVDIAAGGGHSLALQPDGTVVAWGRNYEGQATVPRDLKDVVAVAAGEYQSAALQADGTVVAWGRTAVPAGLMRVVAIAGGYSQSLALVGGVLVPVSIISPPQGRTVTADTSVTLSVVAGGTGPFTYQWRLAGPDIPAANGPDYTIDRVELSNEGAYTVVVSNVLNSVTSAPPAWLTVPVPARIISQPQSRTNVVGTAGSFSVASFSVTAEGTAPLTYQWRKGGINLTDGETVCGAVTAMLTLTNVQLGDLGDYTVVVTNNYGSVTSQVAVLSKEADPWQAGLTAAYLFNGDARDVSGNGRDGAVYGVSVAADRLGAANTAYAFAAPGAHVDLPPSFSADQPEYTICLWFNTSKIDPGGQTILNTSPQYGVAVQLHRAGLMESSHRIGLSWGDGTAWMAADSQGQRDDFQPDRWYFLVLRKLGNELKLYVDGQLNNACTADSTNWNQDLAWTLGSLSGDGSESFDGRLDDVYFYARPLSIAEIRDLCGTLAIGKARQTITFEVLPPKVCGNGPFTLSASASSGLPVSFASSNPGVARVSGTTVTIVGVGSTTITASQPGDHIYYLAATDVSQTLTVLSPFPLPVPSRPIGFPLSAPMIAPIQGTVVVWGGNYGITRIVPAGLSNVVAVAAGDAHCLALKSDGTVVAWGSRHSSQDDGSVLMTVPPGLNDMVAVAAGAFHGLALKRDGTVFAWGDNWGGQTDTPPGLTNVVAIAGGYVHSLALRADGTVAAWGKYQEQGAWLPMSVPTGLGNVVAIAAGWFYNLALRADGTVVAWGDRSDVPPGLTNVVAIAGGAGHSLALQADGTVVAWGNDSWGQRTIPPGLTNMVGIAGGGSHSLALRADGTIVAWGRQFWGSLTVPTGLPRVLSLSAGTFHNVALQIDGTVVEPSITTHPTTQTATFGVNLTLVVAARGTDPLSYQWRRNGTNLTDGGNRSGAATASLLLTNVQWGDAGSYDVVVSNRGGTSNSAAAALAVGLTVNGFPLSIPPQPTQFPLGAPTLQGRVIAWGLNDYGETTVPPGLMSVVAIAAGYEHSLALQADGTVVAWGHNYFGQATVPPGLTNVVAIAAGGYHSLALKADGTVVAWGESKLGQITVPPGLTRVVAVAGGTYHSLALKADGTVVAWGYNQFGETTMPPDLTNVVAIVGGHSYSLALKADGTVLASGRYLHCDGSVVSWKPVIIPSGLMSVVGIAAGSTHSLALKADGMVAAWGRFYDYDIDYSYIPVTVPSGLMNVVSIAAGDAHSLALQAGGTVAAWGEDYYGQLTVPPGLTNVVAIAAGHGHNLALVVDVRVPVSITSAPQNQTVVEGTNVTFTVTASGAAPLSYQWRKDGANLSDGGRVSGATTASLRLADAQLVDAGIYDVVVENVAGSVTSQASVLTMTNTSIALATVALSSLSQTYDGTPRAVTVTTTPPGLAVSVTYSGSAFAPINAGSYAVVATVSDPGYTASSALGTLAVSKASQSITFGELPAKVLGDAPFVLSASASSGLPVSFNSGAPEVARISGTTLTVVGVGSTTIAASQAGDSNYLAAETVPQSLTVSGVAPIITSQPQSCIVAEGRRASFNVSVSGTEPFSYQWQFNGASLQGETMSTLTFDSVSTNQAGAYTVLVTNVAGTVISQAAILEISVLQAPTIIHPGLVGRTFTVEVEATVGFTYTLEYKDLLRDANWSVSQQVAGDGSTKILADTLSPVATRFYRIRVE